MFIGYPRSGHSLVGSLINAHRNAVICHELHALGCVRAGFTRDELFAQIIRRDKWFATERNYSNSGYSYQVPGQWQSRYERLRVIGDKQGAGSSFSLMKRPEQLQSLRNTVKLPVKFLHVVRHPMDNISTMRHKNLRHTNGNLDKAIEVYFELCEVNQDIIDERPDDVLSIKVEDIIAHPEARLADICRFLTLEHDLPYLEACASIVFDRPRKTRDDSEWKDSQIARVIEASKNFKFLDGYKY